MRIASAVSALMLVCAAIATSASSAAQKPAAITVEQYEALMKKIGPAYETLRKQLQSNDAASAAKEAEKLGEHFGEVERFWAQQNRDDAVKWAEQARTRASDAAGAAVTGNAKKAIAAADNLGAACKQCHAAYREPDGAGGYRMKK